MKAPMISFDKRYTRICVIDLEATCWPDQEEPGQGGKMMVEPRMETIEIGAMLLDRQTLQPIREIDAFIQPLLQPKLSDFCVSLTHITQDNVNTAGLFPEVFSRFCAWLGVGITDDVLLASWGQYDRNQLVLDCALHEMSYPFGTDHWNVKMSMDAMGWSNRMGMLKAMGRFGLQFEGTHHRGIDDAKNLVRIIQELGKLGHKI